MNIDGTAKGCPGLFGAGGIFRLHNKLVVGSFAIPLGTRFAFKAEMCALMTTVRLAIQHDFSPLWIETDSSCIIHLVQSRSSLVP